MSDRFTSLPAFTCIDAGNHVDLWPDSDPCSYGEANEIGRGRAAELTDVIRRTQSPVLLGHVIEAIVAKGRIGGMEIGFFHALSIEILNPEKIVEFVATPPERQFRIGHKIGHLAMVIGDESQAAA